MLFRSVITNLINNAIKFTKEGVITVGYELLLPANMLYFYVKDTGCGIPEDKLNAVFDRFVKLNDFIQGTGLGLSISKTIVERLGGEIKVESEVGRGSLFSFTIPYTQIEIQKESVDVLSEISLSLEQKAKGRKVILIAEDTASNYVLFETILKENYKLIHALDGVEAVDMFHRYNPDLVLMDIKMPRMDGVEAMRLIRQDNLHVPIIAVTAHAFVEDEESILENGFSAFVSKPIKKRHFLNVVNEFMS